MSSLGVPFCPFPSCRFIAYLFSVTTFSVIDFVGEDHIKPLHLCSLEWNVWLLGQPDSTHMFPMSSKFGCRLKAHGKQMMLKVCKSTFNTESVEAQHGWLYNTCSSKRYTLFARDEGYLSYVCEGAPPVSSAGSSDTIFQWFREIATVIGLPRDSKTCDHLVQSASSPFWRACQGIMFFWCNCFATYQHQQSLPCCKFALLRLLGETKRHLRQRLPTMVMSAQAAVMMVWAPVKRLFVQ